MIAFSGSDRVEELIIILRLNYFIIKKKVIY